MPNNDESTLPIFRLGDGRMTRDILDRLTHGANAPLPPVEPGPPPPGNIMSRAPLGPRLDFVDGDTTYIHQGKLWRPSPEPVDFTDEVGAIEKAEQVLRPVGLLAQDHPDIAFERRSTDGTRIAIFDTETQQRVPANGKAFVQLDLQVRYSLFARVDHPTFGDDQRVPVIGPGSTAGVTVGPGGEVLGLRYGARRVTARIDGFEMISKADSAEALLKTLKPLDVRINDSVAAYKHVIDKDGPLLSPVWVHSADVRVYGRWFPLKRMTLSAIRGGRLRSGLTCGGPAPPSIKTNPNGPVPRAAAYWLTGPGWCNEANAKRFLGDLQAAGWTIALAHGGNEAIVTDWTKQGSQLVDGANIVFYSGHADGDGWSLKEPSGAAASFDKPPSVTFGDQGPRSLNWIVISACGPMQDLAVESPQHDVFKWRGMFNGLHMLLGHAVEIGDDPEEGRRFVKRCLAGYSVAEAWFLAASDVGGGILETWPGILYPRNADDEGTLGNKLAGNGQPVEPSVPPKQFVAMWVPS